jgi:hypothetical protein
MKVDYTKIENVFELPKPTRTLSSSIVRQLPLIDADLLSAMSVYTSVTVVGYVVRVIPGWDKLLLVCANGKHWLVPPGSPVRSTHTGFPPTWSFYSSNGRKTHSVKFDKDFDLRKACALLWENADHLIL